MRPTHLSHLIHTAICSTLVQEYICLFAFVSVFLPLVKMRTTHLAHLSHAMVSVNAPPTLSTRPFCTTLVQEPIHLSICLSDCPHVHNRALENQKYRQEKDYRHKQKLHIAQSSCMIFSICGFENRDMLFQFCWSKSHD